MRGRTAYQDQAGDARGVAAIGLERDLHAHRVPDQDRAFDQGVVEHARDVVGEIFDCDRARISRRCRSTVAAIVEVQTEPIAEVLA